MATVNGTRRVRRLAHFPALIQEDLNPYARLLYGELAAYGFEAVDGAPRLTLGWLCRARPRVQLLHFHWNPHHHYARRAYGPLLRRVWERRSLRRFAPWLSLASYVVRLAAARLLGYRLVWTIHEVYPHDAPHERQIDRFAARALLRLSHVLLAHDRATATRARAELGRPAGRIQVVPHGSYIGVYPQGRDRQAVRAELGLPSGSFVFLAFGHLRRVKRLDVLFEVFRSLPLPDVRLVVAGGTWDEELGEAVRATAARDSRVHLLPCHIPDSGVAELFGACDAAVLARGDGWTSGSLILALSQGVPVVAARTPTYEELLADGAAGWLFEPGDSASLRAALVAAACDPAAARAKGASALRQAQRLSWSESAARVAEILLGTTNRARHPRVEASRIAEPALTRRTRPPPIPSRPSTPSSNAGSP